MGKFRKLLITGVLVMIATLNAGCSMTLNKDFDAEYYRGSHENGYSAFLLNSAQDFDALISKADTGCDDFAAYDDAFFARSSLIALFLPIGSGSIRLKVSGIEYDADNVTVWLDKFCPQLQTCDMSYWLILVDPHKKLAADTKVGFDFRGIAQALPDLRHRP